MIIFQNSKYSKIGILFKRVLTDDYKNLSVVDEWHCYLDQRCLACRPVSWRSPGQPLAPARVLWTSCLPAPCWPANKCVGRGSGWDRALCRLPLLRRSQVRCKRRYPARPPPAKYRQLFMCHWEKISCSSINYQAVQVNPVVRDVSALLSWIHKTNNQKEPLDSG